MFLPPLFDLYYFLLSRLLPSAISLYLSWFEIGLPKYIVSLQFNPCSLNPKY